MDFRSCPDCKASVLEEDVDDCPFCGASMSGKSKPGAASRPSGPKPAPKPGGKPAPPAAGQKKSSPSTPAGGAKPAPGKPTGRPSPAGKPDSSASDDPFDVDTSALRRAVKLVPKPIKGRTQEVVCPMCETPGYMLPADAGKDVHCCNPDCMVPVFKTKKPKVEEAPQVEAKGNRTLLIGGVAGVLVVGALAAFFLLPKKPEDKPQITEFQPTETIKEEKLVPTNHVATQAEKPLATLPEIQQRALNSIVDRARQRDKNRHIEYGYQLAAESFAQAGDFTRAQEQLRRLQSAGAGVAYLQIEPIVEIGWQQLKSGKTAEAAQSAKDALAKARNLPRTIRKTHDAIISLVALLAATGQIDDANTLINQELDPSIRGVLSVAWRCALDSRTFNVDDESRFTWHVNIPEPLRMGAVEALVARQHMDTALKLAAAGQTTASQAACRAAWAGRLGILQTATAADQVTAAIEAGKFDAATQAQMWSSVADAARFRKNPPLAQSAMEKAVAALETLPAPTVLNFPNRKAVYDSDGRPHAGLPDPAPAKSAAQAASNVSLVQLGLGQQDAALKSLQLALDYFRSMTPSPMVTKSRLEECQKQEPAVRSDLARALSLGNNEERIRIAFNRYRQQCNKLNDLARERLELQVTLLRAAASAGLVEQVWSLARERQGAGDEQQREPYFETSLPSLIYSLADAGGLTALTASVKAPFQEKPLTPDPLDLIAATTRQQIASGKISAASTVLEKAYRSNLSKRFPFHLDLIALQSGGQVLRSRTTEETIAFIQGLYDLLIQEDLFILQAGDSVQRGTAPQLWRLTENSRELDALEFVSLYRGFVSGITGQPKSTGP